MGADTVADAHQAVDLFLPERQGYLPVKILLFPAAAEEIRKDNGAAWVLMLLGQEIQRDLQGVQIGAIAVVDDRAVVDAALKFQPHRDAREPLQFGVDPLRGLAEI